MENAIWNGVRLKANEVSKDYFEEKEVRKASSARCLICPDEGCKHPILKYCHGKVKEPYFAHRDGSECDYMKYEKNKGVFRNLKVMLYEHFKMCGYHVSLEVKTLAHHYCDLLFEWPDGSKTALELGTKRTTVRVVEELKLEYEKAGISVVWIVVDDAEKKMKEQHTFFLNRYCLNENNDGNLIAIDINGKEIVQYKMDKQCDKKQQFLNPFYTNEIFAQKAQIEDLIFDNGVLTIKGFQELFCNFQKNNQSILEEQNRMQEEMRQKHISESWRQKQAVNDIWQQEINQEKKDALEEYVAISRNTEKELTYMEMNPKVSTLNKFLDRLESFSGIFMKVMPNGMEVEVKGVTVRICDVYFNIRYERFEILDEEGKITFLYVRLGDSPIDVQMYSNYFIKLNLNKLENHRIEGHMRREYRCHEKS